MKKMILTLTMLLTMAFSASAMSYEQAREQALFLTDKMAYELNLTDEQYEAAYEVNLDYLMGINGYDDVFGVYWRQRNTDLSYILLDWQYRAYVDALYFYRPIYWDAGYWHFRIFARYPRRDYFFFGRPNFVAVYHGGHSWRMNGGRSWYHGRDFGPRPGRPFDGMRDGFNRGDFGRGNRGIASRPNNSNPANRSWGAGSRNGVNRNSQVSAPQNDRTRNNGGGTSSFGGARTRTNNAGSTVNRQSSTRTTVSRPSGSNRRFGTSSSAGTSMPRNTFSPSNSSTTTTRPSSPTRSTSSFGGARVSSPSQSAPTRSAGSFGGGRNGGGAKSGGSVRTGGGHFGR